MSNNYFISAAPTRSAFIPQQHSTSNQFSVDFTKTYAKRRPDEPRSHYAQRLKFINELLSADNTLADDRIEVLSNCYTNVKFLNNCYCDEIMATLEKHDPDLKNIAVSSSITTMQTPLETRKQEQQPVKVQSSTDAEMINAIFK